MSREREMDTNQPATSSAPASDFDLMASELTKQVCCIKYSLMAGNAFGIMLGIFVVLFGISYHYLALSGGDRATGDSATGGPSTREAYSSPPASGHNRYATPANSSEHARLIKNNHLNVLYQPSSQYLLDIIVNVCSCTDCTVMDRSIRAPLSIVSPLSTLAFPLSRV